MKHLFFWLFSEVQSQTTKCSLILQTKYQKSLPSDFRKTNCPFLTYLSIKIQFYIGHTLVSLNMPNFAKIATTLWIEKNSDIFMPQDRRYKNGLLTSVRIQGVLQYFCLNFHKIISVASKRPYRYGYPCYVMNRVM